VVLVFALFAGLSLQLLQFVKIPKAKTLKIVVLTNTLFKKKLKNIV